MLQHKSHVAGRYKIEAVKVDSGERRLLADWFPNIITDIGLNRLGTADPYDRCVVGTGSATPATTDTQLQTFVASTTTLQSSSSGAQNTEPYYGYYFTTYRFAAGAAAGNLAEVGMGWANTSLFSRALILDGLGNPTTITVLADEFLDVTYEARLYPPTTDSVYNVTISGVVYTFTSRAASVTSSSAWGFPTSFFSGPLISDSAYYNGSIGAITTTPSGTSVTGATNLGTYSIDSYSNNSLERTFALSSSISQANLTGGISAMLISGDNNVATTSCGAYQIGVSPAIDKDATKTLTLNFGVSWARKTL